MEKSDGIRIETIEQLEPIDIVYLNARCDLLKIKIDAQERECEALRCRIYNMENTWCPGIELRLKILEGE